MHLQLINLSTLINSINIFTIYLHLFMKYIFFENLGIRILPTIFDSHFYYTCFIINNIKIIF
jgi:hypothetical protein